MSLRRWAEFCARNRERLTAPPEPEVVLLVPSGDWFSPRDTATAATRRAVEVLQRDLLVRVRAVVDVRAAQDLGQPRAIVLPACRGPILTPTNLLWVFHDAAPSNALRLELLRQLPFGQ